MKKIVFIIIVLVFFTSCMKSIKVDLIVHNAQIHSMDFDNKIYEAMAIQDGKIVEMGAERQILNKYRANEKLDAQKKSIYPGFTDAHIDLFEAAKHRKGLDLSECKSMNQLLMELEVYQQRYHESFLIGFGWGMTKLGLENLPNNKRLNEVFPNTPVCLYSNDSKMMLVNEAFVKKMEIDKLDSTFNGVIQGSLLSECEAILPNYSPEELTEHILEIQQELLMYGITYINAVNLNLQEVELLQELAKKNQLIVSVYGMLDVNASTMKFAKNQQHVNNNQLTIRGFNTQLDGNILKKLAYLNQDSDTSKQLLSMAQLDSLVNFCRKHHYQLRVSAHGNAAITQTLQAFSSNAKQNPDHRWEIFNPQLIDSNQIQTFLNLGVIPVVQTNNLTDILINAQHHSSKNLVPYASLLRKTGMMLIGSNYPKAALSPANSIYFESHKLENIATNHHFLNLSECIKAYTIWPAIANFREKNTGKLIKGMDATFTIFEHPFYNSKQFQTNFAIQTYIKGKQVYTAD